MQNLSQSNDLLGYHVHVGQPFTNPTLDNQETNIDDAPGVELYPN